MYVIVGLGNPGKKYAGSRHNIGFEVIDFFANKNTIEMKKIKHKAIIGEGFINNKKVMLVKPQTFMNLSGESLLDIVNYYDVPLDKIIVIYDDIDIPVGKLRLRSKGSAGSHNGMKSIISQLQDDQFPRLRIGIGRPEHGDLVSFVLGKFAGEEKEEIKGMVEQSAQAIEVFISQGIAEAMNQCNC